jgi:phosphatidylglycerophosphate synthase
MSNKVIVKSGLGYIDTVLTNIYLPTIDYWHCMKVTPNMLTTFGLITSAASLYYFNNKKPTMAIIFLILRCYFDYADGLLARKHNQVTKFGDLYDHIVDLSYGIGFFLIVFLKSKNNKYLLSILALFYGLFTIHMGCLEKEYSQSNDLYAEEETSISYLKHLSYKPNLMRLFDNGTLYIVMSIIVLIICKEDI